MGLLARLRSRRAGRQAESTKTAELKHLDSTEMSDAASTLKEMRGSKVHRGPADSGGSISAKQREHEREVEAAKQQMRQGHMGA